MKDDINLINIKNQKAYQKAKSCMIDDSQNLLMTKFFKAFADETRLKIINSLLKNSLCVGDVALLLNMTKSAVSHQLKYLKNLRVVKSQKVGKEVIYSLDDEHVEKLFAITYAHTKGECDEG